MYILVFTTVQSSIHLPIHPSVHLSILSTSRSVFYSVSTKLNQQIIQKTPGQVSC